MSLNNKLIVIILVSISLFGCGSPSPVEEMRWLEGNWKQTNHKKNKFSLETWKYDNGEMVGKGYIVMQDQDHYDTIFTENLRIILREQTLFYEADLSNANPVLFRLDQQSGQTWTFSNPQHDFPKNILYEKTEKGFTARVNDGTRENTLIFERL